MRWWFGFWLTHGVTYKCVALVDLQENVSSPAHLPEEVTASGESRRRTTSGEVVG